MDRRDVTIAFLAAMLLMTALSGLVLIAASPGEYDPWMDIDDNGIINMLDIYNVALLYGATGTPITKASIEYDSDWIDITDKCGETIVLNHGLGTSDLIVDLQGRVRSGGSPHQIHIGCTREQPAWSKTYGGVLDEVGTSMVKTIDGGYAVTAYSNSPSAATDFDYWLVKLDWTGNVDWSKMYDYEGLDDRPYCVIQTSDGGFALVGYGTAIDYTRDAWLVKTDSVGTVEWERAIVGPYNNYEGYCLVQTNDGGYVIAGHTQTFYRSFVAKYDSSGNNQWIEFHVYGSDTIARCLVQSSDGGYAVAGYVKSGPITDWNVLLFKTDSLGISAWQKTYGGANDDVGRSVVNTRDGGFAIGAVTSSYGPSSNNLYLIKTDGSGNEQWSKTYGPADEDMNWPYADVVQTRDNGYAIAGYKYVGTDNYDMWIVKADYLGNLQWDKNYGGGMHELATSIAETDDGGYALWGWTQTYGYGGQEGYLVKTEIEQGLALTGITDNEVYLWRGYTDTYWNFMRVRLWKPKP